MNEVSIFENIDPAGTDGNVEDNAPVNVDAIRNRYRQGRRTFRHGRSRSAGERIIAQAAGFEGGNWNASRSVIDFTSVSLHQSHDRDARRDARRVKVVDHHIG